jgi:GH25 family lysozyme M1 (1,4-beta-N-acetylmuramidase)
MMAVGIGLRVDAPMSLQQSTSRGEMIMRIVTVCIAAFAALLPASADGDPAPIDRQRSLTRGELQPAVIDLSHKNLIPVESISSALENEGVLLILHRATMGKSTGDPKKDIDREFHARAARIVKSGFRLGAYHWGTRTGTGEEQADDFLKVVRKACESLGKGRKQVLLALDWESHPENGCYYMDPAKVLGFLRRVTERTGKRVLVYSNQQFLRERRTEMRENKELWKLLAEHPLWIARYSDPVASIGDKVPDERVIPAAVLPILEGLPWTEWHLWQYTEGENGQAGLFGSGIVGGKRVDRSVFRGSLDELRDFVKDQSWNCEL